MIGIIIQARTGSTRLPQKMTIPFFESMGILEILLKRLTNNIDCKIIVATTNNEQDNIIEEITINNGCSCYRGSEDDVLSRFIDTAEKYNIKKIIRVCADNPFLDMESLKTLIKFSEKKDKDYISFCTSNGTPTIKTHYGFWAEFVTLDALKKVNSLTDEKLYHEHVTNFIYTNNNLFSIDFIQIPKWIEDKPIRLTLDTQEDFEMQQSIFKCVVNNNLNFNNENVINFIDKNIEYYAKMEAIISQNTK